jgi:hypothetical protein
MAKNTSIPVPKVLAYGTFGPFRRSARSNEICDGQFYETYIYMTLAKGQSLENVWDSCDDSSRKAISKQLTTYLEQLRKLEGSYIGSLNNGPVLDMASPSIKSKGTYVFPLTFSRTSNLIRRFIQVRSKRSKLSTLHSPMPTLQPVDSTSGILFKSYCQTATTRFITLMAISSPDTSWCTMAE